MDEGKGGFPMLVTGLFLMVAAGIVAALDFFGITPGAAGVVSLTLVLALALFLGGALRASLRHHHWRHAHH
jgi:hypothetical protein